MEQDKTKILSDLYAIRATMSVVAMNDDSSEAEKLGIRETNDEIEKEKSLIVQKKHDTEVQLNSMRYTTHIANRKKDLDEAQEKLQNAKKDFEYKRKQKEEQYKESRHSFKHYFTFVPGKVWGIYCGVDAGIWLLLYIIMIIAGTIGTTIFFIVVFALPTPIVLFIIHPIVYLYYWSDKVYEYKKYEQESYYPSKEKLEECQKDVENLENEIVQYKAAISRGEHYVTVDDAKQVEAELSVQEKACQRDVMQLENEIPPHESIIKIMALLSYGTIESAKKAYPLIDFRDWENVDLLIYYFETGRADDMKEALQLVDRQRQTDQIARAIAMASAAICSTINSSIARLGSALAESFSVLSRQMARQHAEMMYQMERQAEAQGEMFEAQNRELRGLREQAAAEMSMQVSAQAMNQALLEKISVSSKHLAEQMDRQMREVHRFFWRECCPPPYPPPREGA